MHIISSVIFAMFNSWMEVVHHWCR